MTRALERPAAAVAPSLPGPAPDTSWRRRLLTDLWLFLAVLAVGLVVAVVAALI